MPVPSTGSVASKTASALTTTAKSSSPVPSIPGLAAGDSITWTNSDTVTHTVTKDGGPGPDFDSGNMEVDATFEQKFTVAGTIDYVCTIHPSQTGKITVE